jgi:hypothetical protein
MSHQTKRPFDSVECSTPHDLLIRCSLGVKGSDGIIGAIDPLMKEITLTAELGHHQKQKTSPMRSLPLDHAGCIDEATDLAGRPVFEAAKPKAPTGGAPGA